MEGERVQGEVAMMMTEPDTLVFGCPIDGCPWASLMHVEWSPLPTVLDVRLIMQKHTLALHRAEVVDYDAVYESSSQFTAAVIRMMSIREAQESTTQCWAEILYAHDQEQDGLIHLALRQQAVDEDEVEQFDAWWDGLVKHATDDRPHGPPTSSISGMLVSLVEDMPPEVQTFVEQLMGRIVQQFDESAPDASQEGDFVEEDFVQYWAEHGKEVLAEDTKPDDDEKDD